MKNFLLAILFIPVCSLSFGQEINHENLEPFVQKFELKEDDSVLKELLDLCGESQFLILGETHYSRNISLFTDYLLPKLSVKGFQNFAVEVGPHSGKILSELSEYPDNTIKNLFDFNKKYYFEEDEEPPLPFFEGKEDAEFLKTAAQNNYHIFGIDQEFYNAAPHLLDRIFEMTSKTPDIVSAKEKVDEVVKEYYLKDLETNRFNIMQAFLESEDISGFFKLSIANNENALAIVEALKESWTIYNWNRIRKPSHLKRVSYIREQFLKEYSKRQTEKYVVKIGRTHAGKEKQLNAYDIGNLTETLAKKSGTKSLNIAFVRGFYGEVEAEINNTWNREKEYLPVAFSFFANKEKWVLIDLASLKNEIKNGNLTYPKNISFQLLHSYINNFDIVLIPPKDQPQTSLH